MNSFESSGQSGNINNEVTTSQMMQQYKAREEDRQFKYMIELTKQQLLFKTLIAAEKKCQLITNGQLIEEQIKRYEQHRAREQKQKKQTQSEQANVQGKIQLKNQIQQPSEAQQINKKNLIQKQQNARHIQFLQNIQTLYSKTIKKVQSIQQASLQQQAIIRLQKQCIYLIYLEDQQKKMKNKQRIQKQQRRKELQHNNLELLRTYIANLDKQIVINQYFNKEEDIKIYIDRQNDVFRQKKAAQSISQIFAKQKKTTLDPVSKKLKQLQQQKLKKLQSLKEQTKQLETTINSTKSSNSSLDQELKLKYQNLFKLMMEINHQEARLKSFIVDKIANKNIDQEESGIFNYQPISGISQRPYQFQSGASIINQSLIRQQRQSGATLPTSNNSIFNKYKKSVYSQCKVQSNLLEQIISMKKPLIILALLTGLLVYI